MSLAENEEGLFGFERGDWLERVRAAEGLAPLGQLGPYRLLEEVGRGGQGVVFRAIQPGTGRTIAVKRLLGGSFASPTSLRRFQREAEAAAALVHPGIVTIHGIEFVEGSPLLAMEWVDGVSLTEWARGRPRVEVLRTFLQVCEAVRHAHQHGVLHRDLKPANVLVDTAGRPRLLDFGLAKRPEAGLSTMTETGNFFGTPAYAAPEQLCGEGSDARTDVHALGAILFELLTGRRALEGEGLAVLTRAAALEAPRPSSVQRNIPGDLDAIVLQAMAREPARRYQSVDALAADLQRFLEGRPVLAQGPSATYLVRKFVARNRVTSAALLALLIATLVFAVVSVRQAQRLGVERNRALASVGRETEARRQAEKDRTLAEQRQLEAEQARAKAQEAQEAAERVLSFLTHDIITEVNPALTSHIPTMLEVLEEASRRVPERFADMPATEARVRRNLAVSLDSLGARRSAEREVRRALEIMEAIGEDGEPHADAEGLLGHVLDALGAYPEAKVHLEASLAWFDEQDDEALRHLARSYRYDLIRIAVNTGHVEDGFAPLDLLMATETDELQRLVFEGDRYSLVVGQGRYREALDGWAGLLPKLLERVGENDIRVATILFNMAHAHMSLEEYAAAEEHMRRALASFEHANRPDHPQVSRVLGELARLLLKRGADEEAEAMIERSLSILDGTGIEGPELVSALEARGKLRKGRATTASDVALFQQAASDFERAASIHERAFGRSDPRWLSLQRWRCDCLLGASQFEEAAALLAFLGGLPRPPLESWVLARRAMVAEHDGQDDEAFELYDRAVSALETSAGETELKVEVLRRFAALCRRLDDDTGAQDLELRAEAVERDR
jgi:tetratricopeptide (TPR) repeat protein/predicted Ser/Thr protein kinase